MLLLQAHKFDVEHGLGAAAEALSEPEQEGPGQACISVADGPLLHPLCQTLGTILQRCSHDPLQQPLRSATLGQPLLSCILLHLSMMPPPPPSPPCHCAILQLCSHDLLQQSLRNAAPFSPACLGLDANLPRYTIPPGGPSYSTVVMPPPPSPPFSHPVALQSGHPTSSALCSRLPLNILDL